ncbi:MAG TPA: DUF1592 domain-containing protein, partial [Phycisphaerae bacterium]
MDRRRIRRAGITTLMGLSVLGIFARCLAPSSSSSSPNSTQTTAKPLDPKAQDWAEFSQTVQPFLIKNCINCHGDNMPEAGMNLNEFKNAASLEEHAGRLSKALDMVRSRKMPPKEQPQPTEAERTPILTWLTGYTTKIALAGPKTPGHVTIRRLNRSEYNNTIRDLLGVDYKPADAFPEDDAGYGFDNNGDVLTMAPLLMDKYLTAATTALDRAILVQPIKPPPSKQWQDPETMAGTVPPSPPKSNIGANTQFGANLPLGRVFPYNGEISTEYDFPAAGSYVFRVRGYSVQGTVSRQQAMVAFKVDGQGVDKPLTIANDLRGTRMYESGKVLVTAGKHLVTLAFVNGATKEEDAIAATQPAAVPQVAVAAGNGNGNGNGNGRRAFGGAGAAGNPAARAGAGAPPASAAGVAGAGGGAGGVDANAAVTAAPPAAGATPAAPGGPVAQAAGGQASAGGAVAAAPAAPGGAGGVGGVPGRAGAAQPPALAGRGRGRGAATPVASPTGKPTLGVVTLEVEGPVENTLDRMPESYQKVFVTLPSASVTKEQAAREILTRFATRAFRRPVTSAELDRLMAFWSRIDASGETFDQSIDLVLQPILVSPNFLYRVETGPTPGDPTAVRVLNEYELASRLSYFLWSSMPDDELLNLARDGKLRENLPAQVSRMLASPKSVALVDDFGGQWLQLRMMGNVAPDKKFAAFDEPLREAMTKETELFFSAIISEDRSILDFIDTDFSFMNERLAKFYGRTDVTG